MIRQEFHSTSLADSAESASLFFPGFCSRCDDVCLTHSAAACFNMAPHPPHQTGFKAISLPPVSLNPLAIIRQRKWDNRNAVFMKV
jgi:hypothetical protein